MTATDKEKLEIALGLDQPLPWPASQAEEIALTERRLADPLRDHVPRCAPAHKVNKVLSILDEIERENNHRRFTD